MINLNFKRIFRVYGHHAILGLSIILLIFLLFWWSIFLGKSAKIQQRLCLENMQTKAEMFSILLGNRPIEPVIGILDQDRRFEIVRYGHSERRLSDTLHPRWPRYRIVIRKSIITDLQKKFRRRRLMIIGESGFLFFLILICIVFLYKYVQLAKRSTREIEEFWSRVTHEIKTPITAIKSFLESVKNHSIGPNDIYPYVDMALTQVKKQEQLSENILAGSYLRTENYADCLAMQTIDLHEYIKNYIKNHIVLLSANRFRPKFNQANPESLMVYADPHALKIILDNLVDNAFKYGPAELDLEFKLHQEGGKAVIAISDNGPGFTVAMREKIFFAYKYLETDFLGKKHGSGMGLYISRQLARKMNGDLQAWARKDKPGATFRLYLILREES